MSSINQLIDDWRKLLSDNEQKKEAAESKGSERRQSLVYAAYELIAEKGFEGLRMRDIAGKVGVNIATLHYYYPSKEALILGVLDYLMNQFITLRPEPSQESEERSAAETLIQEFIDQDYQISKQPQLFIVLLELSQRSLRDPPMQNTMKQYDLHWRNHIRELLEVGRNNGEFDSNLDLDQEASTLIALFKGLGFQLTHQFDVLNMESIGRKYVQRLSHKPKGE